MIVFPSENRIRMYQECNANAEEFTVVSDTRKRIELL
jgi:hypothetical protein